jgi:hypothetical protein
MIILAAILAAANTTPCQAESYRYLQTRFPKQIHYSAKTSMIEYCPDNTCDQFMSQKKASCDELSDFLLLYLHYFSDYYELQEWQAQPDAAIGKVLSKPFYAA